jgi:hypothetical protein
MSAAVGSSHGRYFWQQHTAAAAAPPTPAYAVEALIAAAAPVVSDAGRHRGPIRGPPHQAVLPRRHRRPWPPASAAAAPPWGSAAH